MTGLGPVGLAAAMLGRALGAPAVIGVEVSEARLRWAEDSGLFDTVLDGRENPLERIMSATGARGCEASVDCSGSAPGRVLAVQGTRDWGRCAFVGEGGEVTLDVSDMLIHRQISLHGSWVTSLAHMEELAERLVRWRLHPEAIVSHRLPLERAAEAYELADRGHAAKVSIVFE